MKDEANAHFHKYKILKEIPQTCGVPQEEITDWVRVDDAFFSKHKDNLGLEIAVKAKEEVTHFVAPAGFNNIIGNFRYGHWGRDGKWQFQMCYKSLYESLNMLGRKVYFNEYKTFLSEYQGQKHYYGPTSENGIPKYGTNSGYRKRVVTGRVVDCQGKPLDRAWIRLLGVSEYDVMRDLDEFAYTKKSGVFKRFAPEEERFIVQAFGEGGVMSQRVLVEGKESIIQVGDLQLCGTPDSVYMPCPDNPILVDERDGKSYPTVLIGSQCWMAANLNIGVFIRSEDFGNPNSQQSYDDGIIDKYCLNNDSTLCDSLGALYEWLEAMDYDTLEGGRGICPIGWHIPTDAEWDIMINYLGGAKKATKVLELEGKGQFNLELELPPRNADGTFVKLDPDNAIWSSTSDGFDNAWHRDFFKEYPVVIRDYDSKFNGFCVRCVQDSK